MIKKTYNHNENQKKGHTSLGDQQFYYLQVFKDFTNHIKKTNRAVVLSCRLFPYILTACVHYFLSNFYFFTKWYLFKNYEKSFLFHLKSSFCSQDIQFFDFFPSFPDSKGQMEDLWCHELNLHDLHKFADAIFGISQKLLYITSSNLAR